MSNWERLGSYLRPPFSHKSELEKDGTFNSIGNYLHNNREPQIDLEPETKRSQIQRALLIGLLVGLPYVALVAVDQITEGQVQNFYHTISTERRLP